MYKEIHIEYSDPAALLNPVTLQFKIKDTNIAQKWANKVVYCLENNFPIDDPKRFYGFDNFHIEKYRATVALKKCCEIINEYQPIITREIGNTIDLDTLNYLHHIFEVQHGLLDKPSNFFISAPIEVKKALGQLNIQVHRYESLLNRPNRRLAPRHVVTWFRLPRQDVLEIEDYDNFTDSSKFGTVYLLYAEIGKTLEDLANDEDNYIGEDAYRPFRHYTADFGIRFVNRSQEWIERNRILVKTFYEKNKKFFEDRNLPINHPFNKIGHIPLADLINDPNNIVEQLRNRQMVSKVTII